MSLNLWIQLVASNLKTVLRMASKLIQLQVLKIWVSANILGLGKILLRVKFVHAYDLSFAQYYKHLGIYSNGWGQAWKPIWAKFTK